MGFDVYVLVGLDTRTGEYTPLGCNESHAVMERVQQETIETLRLAMFGRSPSDTAKMEQSIASLAILPATLNFDV